MAPLVDTPIAETEAPVRSPSSSLHRVIFLPLSAFDEILPGVVVFGEPRPSGLKPPLGAGLEQQVLRERLEEAQPSAASHYQHQLKRTEGTLRMTFATLRNETELMKSASEAVPYVPSTVALPNFKLASAGRCSRPL